MTPLSDYLLGQGQTIVLVVAHPESPYSSSDNSSCYFPSCYDTSLCDTLLAQMREIVDTALARNEAVLVVGDLNLTTREPQYSEVSRGLQDLHHRVGWGYGHTFGLYRQQSSQEINGRFLIPLLRIDYMLNSPNVTPYRTSADCTLRGSEHCILFGEFALE